MGSYVAEISLKEGYIEKIVFYYITLIVIALCMLGSRTTSAKEETDKKTEFEIKDGVLVRYKGTDSEVKVPVGITVIGSSAFSYNRTITSVILPDSVTRIEDRAFEKCINLKSVKMSDSVTYIGREAFSRCEKLSYIHTLKNVETMGTAAFWLCLKKSSNPSVATVNYYGKITAKNKGTAVIWKRIQV